MYLRKIICENMGPISHVDIEPSFNSDGTPKPLIVVGKNGTGKSILISNIVDSFFEFGDQAYNDLTKKVPLGHSYFKITGGNQIKAGQQGMLCFIKYSAETDLNKKPEYFCSTGQIDFDAFNKLLSDDYKMNLKYQKDSNEPKIITNDKPLFEKELGKTLAVYFPPDRFSIPYWLGKAYSISHEYCDIDMPERYSGNLYKSISVPNSTEDNIKWMIDVIVDAKADILYNPQTNELSMKGNANNSILLAQSKKNVEYILSAILGCDVVIELGYRNWGRSRLVIRSLLGETIAPTIDALSSGQLVLLNMFLTLVRYGDMTDINNSMTLKQISGIVVIDEIEMHLHSDLQYTVLPRLLKLFPKVQFIITSHAPLFLLGMQRDFGDDGFDIIEMPKGEKISAEDFSEFESAYAAMADTKKFRERALSKIKAVAANNEKALIITEGATDWKHMKRAWETIKNTSEYKCLDDKFEFLEYDSVHDPQQSEIELQMGDNELVKICESVAKLPQQRKLIFIADADQPDKTKKMMDSGKTYKNWGNQVYSFQIPVPSHRKDNPRICIEHYYQDAELKTEKEIHGKKCRLFLGNEFDSRGISQDRKYHCSNPKCCGPDKNTIIEGDSKARVTLLQDDQVSVGLPKMQFADAILNEDDAFKHISSNEFHLIFDIIKMILNVR